MLALAAGVLVVSAAVSLGAVAAFSRSVATARRLLAVANAASVAGGVLGLLAARDDLGVLVLVLAGAACGSGLSASGRLRAQGPRWIHRFAIYAGYGATFALMASASLWLDTRGTHGWFLAAALAGVWMLGSACTFAVKTAVVRVACRTRPEYVASLAGDGQDPGYW